MMGKSKGRREGTEEFLVDFQLLYGSALIYIYIYILYRV